MTNKNKTLKRSLSLPMITFFGLGNILGAGIYVLVGKVAGAAGYFAPLAFFVASVVAAISAFTYAELSSRYPVSAGEAVYLDEGLNCRSLTIAVGLMIAFAGMISASAMAHGFAGYLSIFIDMPKWLMMLLVLLVLGSLAIWGINQSVMVAALFTIIEMLGLLMIVFVGTDFLISADTIVLVTHDSLGAIPWLGVFSGAFLAFYAYIGFEDMVNVAEEVKQPEKNMPRAIILAVIISTILYAGVSIVAVMIIPPQQLASSHAPLADVYMAATSKAPVIISLIGVFAVINGALIQIIMASRLLYGMANKGWLPQALMHINSRTRTPVNSTVLVIGIISFFALALELVTLAELTSYIVLTVFALVNLSLIKIKAKHPRPDKVRVVSIWVPRLGFITAVLFLVIQIISQF
jgi:basic amino acid/polyamine antiporter, APA family